MGNAQFKIPSGKNYLISYSKQSRYTPIQFISNETNLVTGIDISNKSSLHLLYSVFYYHLHALGYSLKSIVYPLPGPVLPLDELIFHIIKRGFYSSDTPLSDIIITPKCYSPKLKTIRSLVYLGNIIVAGLVIDQELSQFLFKSKLDIITEVVLIVGYTEKDLLLKCTWSSDIVSVPNEHLSNIKEIWNIEIKSPEDFYYENNVSLK